VPSEFPAGQFVDNQLLVVVLGLIILMLAVLATPVVLSWQHFRSSLRRRSKSAIFTLVIVVVLHVVV